MYSETMGKEYSNLAAMVNSPEYKAMTKGLLERVLAGTCVMTPTIPEDVLRELIEKEG